MRTVRARHPIGHCARLLAAIAAGGCLVAIAACASAPPAGPGSPTPAGKDDDSWVIRGSVTGGPIIGNPPGPYSPRP
jgi:hypothetical protein